MSADIILKRAGKTVQGTVQLTGSKSECNRALIIEALSEGRVQVKNVSDAADTVTLAGILKLAVDQSAVGSKQWAGNQLTVSSEQLVVTKHEDKELQTANRELQTDLQTANRELQTDLQTANRQLQTVDIGPAGTAMRFLTAFYTLQDDEVILTGSARMKQRPIGTLVNALRELGAQIDYVENEGYPPLQIKGGFEQKTDAISIKGDISSQYITALLLIAARLPKGLTLHIQGELTSKPYVEMTLAMLKQAGIEHVWEGSSIRIENQQFSETVLRVEPDWSAASYWYAIAALADEAELFLPGLTSYSLQGDSVITEIMANFGITSQFKDGGVYLKKETKEFQNKVFDMKECPDLAQTIIVVCAALGHNATFTGLETLKIKETDRVKALQNELGKMGVKLIENNQHYTLDCSGKFIPEKMYIHTYEDHRMAMAFAPLALVVPELEFEDYRVVDKSYPAFWEDLQKMGFTAEVKG